MTDRPLLDRPTLTGRHVRLEPLALAHAEALADAAAQDRSTFGWTGVPDGLDGTRTYIETLLADADRGLVVPFAQVRVSDDAPIGCTRYMDLRWWSGRATPDEVEVGGTWLAASAQRTPINTEAKLLIIGHAFDVWGVHRVALATDARNERSRNAIMRIGARFEGVLRNNRFSYAPGEEGRPRDTAVFSITSDEWPQVRTALAARLS
jgi:RimJ/RimL family protein N-acetyltransferase